MAEYKLSETADINKIFIINFSDLYQRYDPNFFKGEFHSLRKRLIDKKFIKIGQVLKSWNRGDGPRDGYYTEDSLNGVNFLRVNNLKNNSIVLTDVKYINRIIHNTKLKRTQVKGGDLIFAISGTKDNLGTVSIIPENIKEANLNSALVRLDLDKQKISNEFFCLLFELSFIRTQIEFTGKGAAQNNLNNNEIKSILIPEISLIEQKILINLYQTAFNKKQQKETQANELLASIDDYLLNELGITLPKKDTSLKSRVFTTKFSEVSGGRFDGYFYQKDFIDFFECIEKGIYPVMSLKKISKKITSGITPLSGGDSYTNSDEGIPFIRSGNINIDGDLDFDDLLYLKEIVHNSTMKSSQVKYNDLMIAIVGATIGQVGIYLDEREANINQAIALIRLKDGNNHNYIKEVIKSSIGQYNLNRLKRPVARANINLEEISTMQIIIPPLKKQTEIANYIQALRNRAKQLQEEAKMVLDEAKKEIEKMILG